MLTPIHSSRIDTKGQTVLPAAFRRELGLSAGATVSFSAQAGCVTMRPQSAGEACDQALIAVLALVGADLLKHPDRGVRPLSQCMVDVDHIPVQPFQPGAAIDGDVVL